MKSQQERFNTFLEKARKAHPNENLDYSKVIYVNAKTKICIIDHDINPDTGEEYGEYWQQPSVHTNGSSHPLKSKLKISKKNSKSYETFLNKAKIVHLDEDLEYDVTTYKNFTDKMRIIDHDIDPYTRKEYGEYWMTPNAHLKGHSHPLKKKRQSGIKRSMGTEEFIKRAKKFHDGENLDYSKVVYINNTTPVCIIDHNINSETGEEYGEYWQRPANHLQYKGSILQSPTHKKDTNMFIRMAKSIHRDENLDYSKVVYIDKSTPVCIIDHDINPKTGQEYGEFWQRPETHLNGATNSKKSHIQCALKRMYTKNDVIEMMKKKHPEEYFDYNKMVYNGMGKHCTMICHRLDFNGKEHGEFVTTPYNFISAICPCPKCANSSISNYETELCNFIIELVGEENVIQHDRTVLNGKELDIYIPSKNLAIEFDGLYWHSDTIIKNKNYHLNKTNKCLLKNIQLIHIFEDEWTSHKILVKYFLRKILKNDNSVFINMNDCKISFIKKPVCNIFLKEMSIQGETVANYYIGAYYNNELVAVMTFLKHRNNEYELNRFAINVDYNIRNIEMELLQFFIEKIKPISIVGFADKRWFSDRNNIYTILGFNKIADILPKYWYFKEGKTNKRIHRIKLRKQILHKKYGFPLSMTEKEMTEKLCYHRVWDCGMTKYIMNMDGKSV